MPTVSEIRAQYPQYADLTDQDLIDRAGATPDTIGVVPNAVRSGANMLRSLGTGTYTLFQEIAARQGWQAAQQWLDQELANREHETADRQIGMRESRLSRFSEDPAGVVSGAIGQAAGSIPLALNPLGWGVMFAGQAGENIQEQREAQNLQPGDSSLATALGAAAVQTGLERFGIEGWAARGFGRGTGNILSRTGQGLAVGAISEGFTEGAQEAIQIAQGNLSDPTRVLGGDMLARVGEAAGLGAIGGGAIRGALSMTGPERTETPQTPASMSLDDALAIIERRGAPVQPTITAQPRALPGVTSRPVDIASPAPVMDPVLSEAMLSPDQREREIAAAALPEDQKINALNLYRQARDQQASTLQAGVERPPGQWGQPQYEGAPAAAQTPQAALPAPEAPVVRDRAVSPLDEAVATMTPEGNPHPPVDVPHVEGQDATRPGDPGVSSLNSPPSDAAVVTAPQPEGAPSQEEIAQAQAVIDSHLNRYRSRGKQGEEVARATQAVVDDDLTNGRITAPQAASAFSMAEAMSSILPANAGQEVRFARQMMGQRDNGAQYEKQGSQTRYTQATPEGMQGLIQLSLADRQLPMAKQTAAHEAWHVMEDWFRVADPKVARELERSFPTQADGTARLQDVDASLLRLLKRNKIGDESYFDYLSRDETGHGPGVFKNPGEAMATVFGAVYDIHASGQPTPMRPLLRKAFDFFVRLVEKVRSSPARGFMEGVAAGRYRQSVGQAQANITQSAVASVQPEPERASARRQEDVTDPVHATPNDAIRSIRRAISDGSFADGKAWSKSGEGRGVGGSGVVHTLSPQAKSALSETGVVAPDMVELPAGSAPRFAQAISTSKAASPFGASVFVYPVEDYAGMRLFMSPDGKAGFALKDSGNGVVDIVSVFSTPRSGYRFASIPLIRLAVEQGGNKLDAFDTVLPDLYAANGFVVRSRMDWNEEFAPEGWDKALFSEFNGGQPDVVFMAYDPTRQTDYAGREEGVRVADYDEAVRLQEAGLTRDSARFQEAMNETERSFVEEKTPDAWRGPVRAASILAQTDQTTQERWRSAAERFNADHMNREFFNTADALVDLERMLPGGYSPLFAALKRSVPRTAVTYTNQFRGHPEVMGTKYRMDRGIGSHFQPVGSTNLGYIYLDGKQFKADPNMNSAMVFVHEAVHHASFNAMRGLEKAAKGGSAMAQEKLRLYDRLRDITAERSMSEDLWGEHLNAGSFAYMTRGRHYRNSSIEEDAGDTSARQSGRDEFLAEAMASPYFQSYLSTIALPEDMQRDFQKLIGNRPRNILQAMVDWLKSALGLANNTVLDGVFILSPEMFNMGHVLPTEETVQSEPNAVRDSARDLPATTKKALDKLSPEGIHGWAMRARANKPLSAGMREQLKSWARTKLVDRYSAIEDMEARLTGQGRMTADMSGYTNLWQAEDADRFLSQMLRTGGSLKLVRPDPTNPNISWFEVDPSSKGGISWLTNMLTGTDPKTGKQRTKADGSPLVETRQEADALMDGFQLYSIVKRGDRLNKEGILTPITSADRQAAADAVKRFPEIIEGYAGYQKFNRNLMQLAVDSGLLEQKDADHFMKHNDYYPFYREIPKNDPLGARKIAGISAKFKLKEVLGGDKPFVDDPITVVLNNASFWMHASMLNNAKQKVVATGRKTGDIRAFDKTKDQPDIKINVRVNGKDYAFASEDPSLTTALESYWGMAPETQKLLNVFGWPARFLRELVTKNPAFMLVSNPIRDSVSAWQATGASMTPIIDTYRGMVEAYTHNQEAIDYMSLGHGGSRRYEDGPMRDAGDLIRDDILIEKGIYSADTSGKLMAVLRKAYLKLDAVSEASDMATRIPIYRSALAETGGNKAEAAWRAREALNFTKRGASTALRAWSMLVPFTNARIQGLDVLVQSLSKDSRIGNPKEDRGQRLTRALTRGAILTTVAVLAEMMFGDDDERKEAPEWIRNQNVLIPLRSLGLADSGLLAIPKPFEYGAIFMTLPEHLYRYINGSQTMRGLVVDGIGSIPASMAYNPVPAAVLPIAEQMVNYSMLTGRPVIGRALQSQAPEWQFTTNTPAFYRETAMAFAQTGIPALMKSMGLELPRFMTSPVTMEHFVRGYTGSLGIQASIAAGAMIGGGDFREFTWDRMPMASTLVRTRNNMGPGGTNTLYDLAEASAELGQQIRRYTEAGNMQMVRELSQQNSALIQARPLITQAQQAMTRLSQQERALIRDPRIPEEVRRRRLQAIEAQKRETVRTMEALRVRVGR